MSVAKFSGSSASSLSAAPSLQRKIEGRSLRSFLLTCLTWVSAIVASIPLFSVLYMLITRGGARLNLEVFTELPPAGFETGGGFGNALLGTFVMVGIAALIAIPVGIMAAIFLAELGPVSKLANVARFAAKTLTGLPSILAGVFAYAMVVLTTGTYSAPAGGFALAVLMLPIVVLTAEEAMKMVPKIMKDAAYGMGSTDTQVIWKVVLPTAMPAILTGVMLAVARAAGETAPLLFTALFSNYWIFEDGHLALMSPTASLAVLIYNFSGMPFDNQLELAWAASLVLVLIVLIVNIVSRIFGKPRF
ncbi:MAG: phosphate ABC transporter permease PstA [Propionivibrio sp.]|uniref:phosphate ABC transporter permease PstA n=1 Tax=Propionivibrio sp. TaxID=2212460 RepID=UPI001A4D223A|nr:phosphate ABC transporter permease PstA [Propionivibrio sp.]MBL8415241.1 phosphate ABC transporter permease PstA [Propionivibrio sp.]